MYAQRDQEMYETVLRQIQVLVLQGQYVFTTHALEQMDQDWQWIIAEDIESAILRGTIVERQWDAKWQEWKYIINGVTMDGRVMDVVVKLHEQVVIITVYLL